MASVANIVMILSGSKGTASFALIASPYFAHVWISEGEHSGALGVNLKALLAHTVYLSELCYRGLILDPMTVIWMTPELILSGLDWTALAMNEIDSWLQIDPMLTVSRLRKKRLEESDRA